MLCSWLYSRKFTMVNSWKDKRISAINRIIKNTRGSTLTFLDEYNSICSSKAKNKMEYKLERKNEKNNEIEDHLWVPCTPRNLPE